MTGRTVYEIRPEGGLQLAGYSIAIDGEPDTRDPRLNDLPDIGAAKAEIAKRIAPEVEAAEAVLSTFRGLTGPATRAA